MGSRSNQASPWYGSFSDEARTIGVEVVPADVTAYISRAFDMALKKIDRIWYILRVPTRS